jgi:hypothetical protein
MRFLTDIPGTFLPFILFFSTKERGLTTVGRTSPWNSSPELQSILRHNPINAETPPSRYGSEVFLSLCRSSSPMMAVWEPDLSLFT